MKKGLGKGLGKGLDAMLAHRDEIVDSSEILEISIKKISPNKDQPRKSFKQQEIDELADSIREFGIIQPLIVREAEDSEGDYIIVAGERRWRAAHQAGLATIPVIVRDYNAMEVLSIALIENVQREDLNPIEEAFCYNRLNEEFGLTQDEVAKKVGKSRSHIANSIRLLKLDEKVLELIAEGRLSMGHAKAIMSLETVAAQVFAAERMVEEGMNVRQAEEFVRKAITHARDARNKKRELSKATKELYNQYKVDLRSFLGTRVNIKENKTGTVGGKIEINYFSQSDLERIIAIIQDQGPKRR
jgi:ParB family chromosome partitioning protein